MRTVIIVGLLSIADAIREDWCDENLAGFYAWIIVASILMDIIDFFRNRN